jgi:hypothetical protein
MTFMAERLKSASKQKKNPKLRKRIGKKDFLFFNDGTAKKKPKPNGEKPRSFVSWKPGRAFIAIESVLIARKISG